MNPYALGWTALNAFALIGLVRLLRAGGRARAPLLAMAALQAVGLAAALASIGAQDWGSLVWLTMTAVNVALCVAGFSVGLRALAVVGLFSTALGVALILLGSFASIAVMAVAAVFCAASAVLPQREQRRA